MDFQVQDLGLLDYDSAYALQRDAAQRRLRGELLHDQLILVQHPPVVTLGRSFRKENLLVTPEYLAHVGVQLREVERGGDVTVHEPGQLVIYPIVDLRQHRQDLHWYLRQLEESIMHAMRACSLETERVPGKTGVWRESRKLASIGVHAKGWVTWHGIALNVENSLATFDHVVPCGIDGVEMTTVAREAQRAGVAIPSLDDVRNRVIEGFAEAFGMVAA